MSPQAQDIVLRVAQVASLPQIYLKVEDVLRDPNSGADDLARVIEGDPALTARLLRLVNSPIYGQVSEIDVVSGAVAVMGTAQLRELVLACSVLNAFNHLTDEVLDLEEFWRHSIACGVMSRAFADMRNEANVERFLVAGLLHDIGRLVLAAERPKQLASMRETAKYDGRLLYDVELEEFGFTHAQLGGYLLEHWKLPERLISSVTWHHQPADAEIFRSDVAIVHCSDVIVSALAMGNSGEIFVHALDETACELLELDDDKLKQLMGTLQQQYRDQVMFILDK